MVERACSIRVLGEFAVVVAGQPVPANAWRHRRGAELIKLLALAPGHRLHREQVMDTLWPELEPDAAAANLRKATHHLRRALGTAEPVVIEASQVALCPDWAIATDAERFEAAARDAQAAGAQACADAAALYGGELLPEDRYAEWTDDTRQRLHLKYIQLLKSAAMWDRVIDADPGDEEAHRALMQAHIDAGNRHAAIRQFEKLRNALRGDLGIGPDAQSVALYERALAMDGGPSPSVAERAGALLAWGLVHWNIMELEEARRCAEEARTLAVQAQLGRELGQASALLGMVAHAQGGWRELFRREFAAVLAGPPALAPYVFDAHLCLAEFFLYGPDRQDEVEPFARSLLATATEAGSVRGQALASLMLGEAQLFAGHLPEARATLTESVALHGAAQAASGQALALTRLAEAEIASGHRWRASRLLARALRLSQDSPLAAHLAVRAYAGQVLVTGNTERAAAVVDDADRALAATAPCPPCSIGFHIAASVTRSAAGDVARSRRHLETAERIAGMWQGGPWEAAVWEARGRLRTAEGDAPQGAALLREAADRFARAGRPLDEARCRSAA